MSSQCETMGIIMTIRILVNWKSLGHLRGEASSPYSKHARLPLEWKQGKASPPTPHPHSCLVSTAHTDVDRQLQHIGLFVSPTPMGFTRVSPECVRRQKAGGRRKEKRGKILPRSASERISSRPFPVSRVA